MITVEISFLIFHLYNNKNHESFVANNKLYVWGGSDTNSVPLSAEIWAWSLTDLQWTSYDTPDVYPSPRASAAGVLYNEKYYLFGGQDIVQNRNGKIDFLF